MKASLPVQQALQRARRPLTIKEIAARTGLSDASVRATLQHPHKMPGSPTFERAGVRQVPGKQDAPLWWFKGSKRRAEIESLAASERRVAAVTVRWLGL